MHAFEAAAMHGGHKRCGSGWSQNVAIAAWEAEQGLDDGWMSRTGRHMERGGAKDAFAPRVGPRAKQGWQKMSLPIGDSRHELPRGFGGRKKLGGVKRCHASLYHGGRLDGVGSHARIH